MRHAPSSALSRRHAAVRLELAARELDALVVSSLPNILYLTNFTGSSAVAVLTAHAVHFVTDFRYLTALDQMRGTPSACPGLELARVDTSYDETLASVLATLPRARVGFEAAHLTVAHHRWLDTKLDAMGPDRPALVAAEGIVEGARACKDSYEMAKLREGARRLSAVARGVVEDVRRGRSEREIALAIDCRIRTAGFERAAFDTIVASGPNAALPHARPGERTLTESDLVVLDFGGVYDSYCVDLTRTVSMGPASARGRDVHAAVREAHDCAIRAVAPAASRFAIDAAAREALGRHGLADAFGHGTGHGLGLEVHENPRIARRRAGVDDAVADEAVAAGMVFTIEPGAYIPGWGGVRIEDDVLVTDAGVELLTDVPTELFEL